MRSFREYMGDKCILRLYKTSVVHKLCDAYCGTRLNCVNWYLLGVHDVEICHILGCQSSRFSWHSPGFVGFKSVLSPCPTEFGSGHHMSWVYPSHKNMTFVTACTNIVTFTQWEKTSVGIRQPSTGH